MGIAGWGWDANRIRSGRLVASSEVVGLGAGNLQNDGGHASQGWQTVGTAARLTITEGVGATWRAFLLARTNLTAAATVRWRVGSADAFDEMAPVRAVTAGAFPAGLTVTRAHSPAGAMATRWTGSAWEEVAANLGRRNFLAALGRWGFPEEPERTNGVTNPRGAGSTAGALQASRLPTGWAVPTNVANGVSATVVGSISEAGMTGVRIQVSGTATATTGFAIEFMARPSGTLAAVGEAWGYSFFHRIVGAPASGLTLLSRLNRLTDAGAVIATTEVSEVISANVSRVARTSAPTDATLARVVHGARISITSGTVCAFMLDLFWPQLERGPFVTSPILPPVGTLAVATRGAESWGLPLPAAQSSGALYVEQYVEQPAAGGLAPVWMISGTDSGIAALSLYDAPPSTVAGVTVRDAAGTVTSGINDTGPLAAGVAYRHVLRWAANDFRLYRGGALVATDTDGAAPTVTYLGGTSGTGVVHVLDVRAYPAMTEARALGLSTTGLAMAPLTYDSGVIPAGVVPGIGQSLLVLPADVGGSTCVCDISDPTNPDGFLNTALAYAGPLVQTTYNIAWGGGLDRTQGGAEVRTRGGGLFRRLDWAARRWDVEHKAIVASEVWPVVMALDLYARRGGNVLYVPDPDSPDLAREAVFGVLTPGAPLTYPYETDERRAWRATIEERL